MYRAHMCNMYLVVPKQHILIIKPPRRLIVDSRLTHRSVFLHVLSFISDNAMVKVWLGLDT